MRVEPFYKRIPRKLKKQLSRGQAIRLLFKKGWRLCDGRVSVGRVESIAYGGIYVDPSGSDGDWTSSVLYRNGKIVGVSHGRRLTQQEYESNLVLWRNV